MSESDRPLPRVPWTQLCEAKHHEIDYRLDQVEARLEATTQTGHRTLADEAERLRETVKFWQRTFAAFVLGLVTSGIVSLCTYYFGRK